MVSMPHCCCTSTAAESALILAPPPGESGMLTRSTPRIFSFLACSKDSVVVDPESTDDVDLLRELLAAADAVVWSRGSAIVALARESGAGTTCVTTTSAFGLASMM